MISGLLKLLLGLLPRAGEAAVGLFRFRNEFLLFSEPDLVIDGDDDAAADDNDDDGAAADDDGDNGHRKFFLINDPNLCTSPTGEKAVLGLGWFGEFQ